MRFANRFFATLIVSIFSASAAHALPFGLGEAADYAVLGLDGVKISMSNSQSGVYGNVGLGTNNDQNFSDGFITGNLVVDPTADNTKSNNVDDNPTGSGSAPPVVTQDLSQAIADALAATAAFQGMLATQNFSDITSAAVLGRTTVDNVIDISGDLKLSGGDVVTLSGNANDFFVLNIGGDLRFSGGSGIALAGGLMAENVIFNVLGSGSDVAFSGGSFLSGTILAAERKVNVSPGFINGAVIAGKDISITSGGQVTHAPFTPNTPVPEPGTILLFGAGASALAARRRRHAAS